jgi:hypothetical protein
LSYTILTADTPFLGRLFDLLNIYLEKTTFQESRNELEDIKTKLPRLLDSYLDQDVDREDYSKRRPIL